MYIITPNTKTCSRCKEVKTFAEFAKAKHAKSGLTSECKACNKVYRDSHKKVRKAKGIYPTPTTKTCTKCKVVKDLTDFHKDKNKKLGVHSACKPCDLGYGTHHKAEIAARRKIYDATHLPNKRAWKANNPEIVLAQKQRRRARKLGTDDGTVTAQFLIDLKIQQHNRCAYCFGTFLEGDIHLDHILALVQGGPHSKGNVVYACAACNLSKNATLLKDWLDLPMFKVLCPTATIDNGPPSSLRKILI